MRFAAHKGSTQLKRDHPNGKPLSSLQLRPHVPQFGEESMVQYGFQIVNAR